MYDSPHQFEPLIPTTIPPSLTDQAADIARAATRLTGMAHASSRQTIRECVRAMNSYYSNRIEALITFRHAHNKAIRPEVILPLYHLFAAGPLTRGEFAQMTGLGERTARSLLSALLKSGLVVSDSALGPVRWGLPLGSLSFLFPELYPGAATKLS